MLAASLSPLNRLMIALCRRDAVATITPTELALVADSTEWDALLAAADAHRIDGVVLNALERLARESVPAGRIVTQARLAPLRLLRRQAIGWDLEQSRVLAWLEKHGLTAVVLKGGALRHTAYEQSAERRVSDLDLLFDRSAIASAQSALDALGYGDPNSAAANALYVEHHFHLQMEHPGGFKLELHWGLTPPGPHSQIDASLVRREALRAGRAGREFLAPRSEHMVLHLASQNTEDSFSRLGRIVDVDRVIARSQDTFDWQHLLSVATTGHLQNALGVTLRLASVLFDTPVPAGFVERLEIPWFVRANIAAMRPVEWIAEGRGGKYASVRILMKAWLETAPGARRDIALKQMGVRRDPLRLIHAEIAEVQRAPRTRLRNLIPGPLKVAGFQLVVWLRALTLLAGSQSRLQMRFWDFDRSNT